MKQFFKHLLLEFKISLRDKSMIFMNYIFPLGFFFLIGSIMTKIQPEFKEQLIPAMILFTIMASTLLTIPNAIVSAREAGVYRSYKIYGIGKIQVILLITISTLVHILLSSTIIYVCGSTMFEGTVPKNPGALIIICLLFALINIGISIIIGICSSNTRVTTLWAQIFFIPSIIVGGVMLPISMLPKSLTNLTKMIPSTYAMNSINTIAMNENGWQSLAKNVEISGGMSINESLLVLLVLVISSYVVSALIFRWDNKSKIIRMKL